MLNLEGDQNFDGVKEDSETTSSSDNDIKYMSKDERFIKLIKHYSHKMIISKDNSFYQLEQFLMTFLCIISSYLYAYIACFQVQDHDNWEIIFESLFAADVLLTFFVEISPIVNTDPPIRNFTKIAERYFQGTLLYDILTLVPFHKIPIKHEMNYVLYMIKCFRYLKGRNIYNVPIMIKSLKELIMITNFWVIEMKKKWTISSFSYDAYLQ